MTDGISIEQQTYDRLLHEAKAEFGATAMERTAAALAESATPSDPLQRPAIYVPGLTTQAWWNPEGIADVAILERSAEAIRGELRQVLARKSGFQHFDEGPEGFQAEETNFGWNAFYFRWACRDVPKHRAECRATHNALLQMPNLGQQAWFSALSPGTHIAAHCGPINIVLTVHLALIVPPGCEMRVGRETRTWHEGKCLVFDDSVEHEVWHRGQSTRVILLLDVWHPELTLPERAFWSRAIRSIEEAKETAGVASAVDRYRGTLDGRDWYK